jgi:hypothetical protein
LKKIPAAKKEKDTVGFDKDTAANIKERYGKIRLWSWQQIKKKSTQQFARMLRANNKDRCGMM